MSESPILFEAGQAFADRRTEVEMYFGFVAAIVREECPLRHKPAGCEDFVDFPIDRALKQTLMAIGYVVLYNLVESTLRNYVSAIYEDMLNEGAKIEDTKENIRDVVLKGFKKHMPHDFFKREMNDLSLEIIEACWDRRCLFSGNVDLQTIDEAAKRYGFKLPGWSSIYNHGEVLKNVKDNRNALAHGERSFRESVQNVSIDELLNVKEQVVRYLEVLTRNISNYIDNKEYLISSSQHAPASSPQ